MTTMRNQKVIYSMFPNYQNTDIENGIKSAYNQLRQSAENWLICKRMQLTNRR